MTIPPLTKRYLKFLIWDYKRNNIMDAKQFYNIFLENDTEVMKHVIDFIKCQYKKADIKIFLLNHPEYIEYFI
jgi:hypothetical protein